MIIPYDFTPILGGNKSIQFNPADLRNVFMSKAEANGRIGWHDFPGLKLVSSGSESDRGHHVMADVRYVVDGESLYSEDVYGNRTSLGSIPGTDRCIFSDDGTNLAIISNGIFYKYNGSTVSTVSQSVVTNPAWVDFFYNTFVIGGDSQKFATSNVGDIDTWNALNFSTASQSSDSLIRGYVFQGLLYLFGGKSTEIWNYTASGNPPVARRNSTLQDIGIAGKYAVGQSDSYLYWLGDDRRVYQCAGASARTVNTSAVSHIFNEYNVVSDCIVSSFTLKGQVFIMFKFNSAGDCLVYSETNDYWITLSSGTDKNQRKAWYGNAVHYCYGKNLVTDYRNGNTYELDFDTYTDNSDTRLRILIGNPITGNDIGLPQNQVTLSNIVIPMQTGVGLTTGQGVTPQIIYEISPSGGQVYEGENFVSIGALGDHSRKVILDYFATGYEIVPRIMISDPVYLSTYSGGSAEVFDGGY